MAFDPGGDYYAAIAQVVPLFLITLVLEDRVYKMWHERMKDDPFAPAQFIHAGFVAELLALVGLAFDLPRGVNVALGIAVGLLTTYLLIFVCTSLVDVADPDFMKKLPRLVRWPLRFAPRGFQDAYMEVIAEAKRRAERGEEPWTRQEATQELLRRVPEPEKRSRRRKRRRVESGDAPEDT